MAFLELETARALLRELLTADPDNFETSVKLFQAAVLNAESILGATGSQVDVIRTLAYDLDFLGSDEAGPPKRDFAWGRAEARAAYDRLDQKHDV